MLDETLGIFIKLSRELDFFFVDHLENFIWVIGHEWRYSVKTLINEDTKGVPVNRLEIALIFNDLWGDILRSSTESVGSISRQQPLNEPKISNFNVAITAN